MVLAYAQAAGGAQVLAPVLARLQRRLQVVLFAGKYAESVFDERGLGYRPLGPCSSHELGNLLEELGLRPGLILTSAASLPQEDMVEKYFWQWGHSRGITSVGVLDQWHNFALRFSGPRAEDYMAFLPSYVVVMDEYCKNNLAELGVNRECILVLGHPPFDDLFLWKSQFSTERIAGFRRSLGLGHSGVLITFLSEAISQVFGDAVGYTEQTILSELITQLRRLPQRELLLVVKPHPRNRKGDFLFLTQLKVDLPFRLHVLRQPISTFELLASSDLVVGMSTTLLLHSIILAVPALSVQIGARQQDLCVACVVGAIPLVKTAEQLYEYVGGILDDPIFRGRYLAGQTRFTLEPGATERIESRIYELLRM